MPDEAAPRRTNPWPFAAILLLIALLSTFLVLQWTRSGDRPIVKSPPPAPPAPPPPAPPDAPPAPPPAPRPDAALEAWRSQVELIKKAIEEKRWDDALAAIPAARALRDDPELKTLEEGAARGRREEEARRRALQDLEFATLKERVEALQTKDRWDAAVEALRKFREAFPLADQDEPFRRLAERIGGLRTEADGLFQKKMAEARAHFEGGRLAQALHASRDAARFYPERQELAARFDDQVREQMFKRNMCRVTAGTYGVGSDETPDEGPPREVTLPPFYIDKYEVTNEEYHAFVSDTGRPAPPHWVQGKIQRGRERHPVVNVSFEDAEAYARWAGKRLPSAEEWEVAARGPDRRKFPFGHAFAEKENVFVCNSLEYGQSTKAPGTTPVDFFDVPNAASPFGVFGMGGNVWEWTSTDRGGMKILKGGSFSTPQRAIRCSNILAELPALGFEDAGFRCVRDAK